MFPGGVWVVFAMRVFHLSFSVFVHAAFVCLCPFFYFFFSITIIESLLWYRFINLISAFLFMKICSNFVFETKINK
jgi:hypothetical protein